MADKKKWKDMNKGEKIATVILFLIFVWIFIWIVSSVNSISTQTTDNQEAQEIIYEEDTSSPTITDTKPEATVSQKNALKSANSYISMGGFSRDGLIKQLEFEKYSKEDAVYGVDNANPDWMKQAAMSAESYMKTSSFSRGSLIQQLLHEGFTQEQSEHGATSVGL